MGTWYIKCIKWSYVVMYYHLAGSVFFPALFPEPPVTSHLWDAVRLHVGCTQNTDLCHQLRHKSSPVPWPGWLNLPSIGNGVTSMGRIVLPLWKQRWQRKITGFTWSSLVFRGVVFGVCEMLKGNPIVDRQNPALLRNAKMYHQPNWCRIHHMISF